MADRDSILEPYLFEDEDWFVKLVKEDGARIAMDKYMEATCLELLEYMAKNMVICGHYSSSDGPLFKINGHQLLTKEQLFENFL